MNRFATLSLITCATLGLGMQANAYQVEGRADFTGSKTDGEDPDVFRLGGEYYIQPVDDSTGPLAEAAFLDQAMSARVFYEDFDNGDGLLIGGRYVDPGSQLVVEADIGLGDLENDEIKAGMYLDSHTQLLGKYVDTNLGDGYGVEYKNLMTRNDGTYLNVGGELTFIDGDFGLDTTRVAVEGDYYLDKMTSVGAEVGVFLGDLDGETINIRGEKFLSQTLSLNVGLGHFDYDVLGDGTTFTLGGTIRM